MNPLEYNVSGRTSHDKPVKLRVPLSIFLTMLQRQLKQQQLSDVPQPEFVYKPVRNNGKEVA